MSDFEAPKPANEQISEESYDLWERMHSLETLAWVAMVRAKEVKQIDDDDPAWSE